MPGPVPTPTGVVRAVMGFAPSTDANVRSRFDMSYGGGPPSTSDLLNWAALVSSAFGTHLAALLTSSDALEYVEGIDLQVPGTPAGVYSTAVAGTRSGTQVPLSVTACINFTPDRRYRGSKPKIFLPFGTDSDVNNPDTWTSTFKTAVDSGWAAFIAELAGATVGSIVLGGQVCVSYYSGTEPNPNPRGRLQRIPTPRTVPLVQPITNHGLNLIFGAQRRRLRT
jgi:hypothetical protein